MLYGVHFNEKYHTLSDWGLYLCRGWSISAPAEKRNQMEVPGADGLVDVTQAVNDRVAYGNRTMNFVFKSDAPRPSWDGVYTKVVNALHGENMKIVLDSDMDFYYMGNVTVGPFQPSDRIKMTVNVAVDAEPFKWEHNPVSVKAKFTEIGNMGLPVLISEGQDVSRQDWNTDLRFGTKEIPAYDFSTFEKLTFTVTPWKSTKPMLIQLIDGAGVIYNHEIAATEEKSVTVILTKETLTGAGLDMKTIWRILCSHCPEVKLTGTPAWSVNVTLEGGKRNTAPVVEVPAGIDVAVFEGKTFTLTEGANQLDELELRQGENIVTFMNSENLGQTGELTVSYRRGWL